MKGINDICFDLRNTHKYQYDGELINEFIHKRVSNNRNKLTIFHLMGQHVSPKQRFRQENTVFKLSDIKRGNMSDDDKQAIVDYDNATLYNDSVVDAIMGMYSNEDAVVIYFSDHGDEANDFRLHVGRSSEYDKYGAKLMHCLFDIPFIVYCTPKYIEGHPDIVNRIEASVDNPFMTDDLPHLLFDLAGIHTKWFDPKRSVINEAFNKKRKRLVSNQDTGKQYDYDKYCKKTDGWPNTQSPNN